MNDAFAMEKWTKRNMQRGERRGERKRARGLGEEGTGGEAKTESMRNHFTYVPLPGPLVTAPWHLSKRKEKSACVCAFRLRSSWFNPRISSLGIVLLARPSASSIMPWAMGHGF